MSAPPNESATLRRDRPWAIVGAGVLLVAAVGLAYANSLRGVFVYDDRPSIVYNGTIRHLSSWREILHPPGGGITVSGRPVLNFTFALNYALGGLNVRGYHVTNILIHAAVALALFGLIRRTLAGVGRGSRDLRSWHSPYAEAYRRQALAIALGVAGLWALDPLHTEAVTYIIQRAESLMSLFFVLTLYAFVRSVDSVHPWRWRIVAWVSCALGMATKENMVAVPIIVLFYDRAFIGGSLVGALRLRWKFYAALAVTWIPLAWLVISTGGDRGGSAGFDVGVTPWSYWLTQFPALLRYLALTLWPTPLVFDYGPFFVTHFGAVLWPSILVTALIIAALYAMWRRPVPGFIAAAALAILAPTSVIPGTAQMIVEHRMYLPLAALLTFLVPLAVRWRSRGLVVSVCGVATAFCALTVARNRAYRSELALWQDTVAKRPESAIAHSSLGAALKNAGHPRAAINEHRLALTLNPNYAPALTNLGIALAELGSPDAALPYVTRATEIEPKNAQAQLNLGVTLDLLHRSAEALPHYVTAVAQMPALPAAQNDLGDALSRAGKLADGLRHLREAIALDPDYAEAYFNLATALGREKRMEEAQAAFDRGAALRPNDGSAHLTWANFLGAHDHMPEAMAEYQRSLTLDPQSANAHYSYATALAGAGRYNDAIHEFEAAIRLRPDYAEAENNLGNTFLALERPNDAIPHYENALRLRPNDPRTRNNLGLALAETGHLREATNEFEAAIKLAPDFQSARQNLEHARAQLGE